MDINKLHKQVWTRFIRMPYGHLRDYADENGHIVIPSADELQAELTASHGGLWNAEAEAYLLSAKKVNA